MTQKYLYVRRELYEQNPAKKLNLRRSFTDMARLFKRLLWILLIIVAGCGIWVAILMVKNPSSPIIFIPMTLCMISAITTLIPREKFLYNESARQEELAHIQSNYQKYVVEVRKILETQGIKSPEQILNSQKECEASLSAHTEKYNKIGNKTYDLLIGVPLGAFVAGIIYANKTGDSPQTCHSTKNRALPQIPTETLPQTHLIPPFANYGRGCFHIVQAVVHTTK